MARRILSIWFPFLLTDWMTIRRPELKETAVVCAGASHGRMMVIAANHIANKLGIRTGMPLADARALVHELEVFDEKLGRKEKLLEGLARWAIRYTPLSSTDGDGILLDISGCSHLWGGEEAYLKDIICRLHSSGYTVKAAIADTIGAAWAFSRYGKGREIVQHHQQYTALLSLPPSALRIPAEVNEKLHKLGLNKIERFIKMPRSVLRRRFGEILLQRISQAMGDEPEAFTPVDLIQEFEERLPCLEPIRTATAIEIAIQKLLEKLCQKLKNEGLGIRKAILKGYRIDGKIITSPIGTNRPSDDPSHLLKLFALNISSIAPGMGIELFSLTAEKTEKMQRQQEKIWSAQAGLDSQPLAQLLDRVAGKVGKNAIQRYLPKADYWPERAIIQAKDLQDDTSLSFHNPLNRPIQLLSQPERIDVTAPIPDYPPMLFIYQGERHSIKKADGPERLERAWWLESGEHRDYYTVEDEKGNRYWIFRSGHYAAENSAWYIHGFFA
ncbi:Y-family DNA polymerase [Pedobacter ghigonis]|uniref:Y-family DNA polymerase n=1 Tax=Pedobacter ghigonis TaxID=2730403 RepID=UPI00158C616D|nr:DNA polymerase Y family protein [Pedobacter ghigonis]